MDELVRQALAKWPDVPDCTGWLALDARGRWRIGEAEAGPRKSITNAAMNAYISRNYVAHERAWIFQNGPQRVFVELEYTPYVWRLQPREGGGWSLVAHTGQAMVPSSVWLDDAGRFLVGATGEAGEPAIGVVHDHDTALVAELLCDVNGEALDDEAIAQLSSADPADGGPSPQLRWTSGDDTLLLPLRRIAAQDVASRFDFEPRPAETMRADIDTRR